MSLDDAATLREPSRSRQWATQDEQRLMLFTPDLYSRTNPERAKSNAIRQLRNLGYNVTATPASDLNSRSTPELGIPSVRAIRAPTSAWAATRIRIQ